MKIWFVDDIADNRHAWHLSFHDELREAHQFESFDSVDSLFDALNTQVWPDILFIDFYIGPRFGHEVISYFQDLKQRPCLIAYSSQGSANRAMLAQGADLSYQKITGATPNQILFNEIQNSDDLQRLIHLKNEAPPITRS